MCESRSLSLSAQDLSIPQTLPKPPNPLSTLAINISKTWQSYLHPLATIDKDPETKSFQSPRR